MDYGTERNWEPITLKNEEYRGKEELGGSQIRGRKIIKKKHSEEAPRVATVRIFRVNGRFRDGGCSPEQR